LLRLQSFACSSVESHIVFLWFLFSFVVKRIFNTTTAPRMTSLPPPSAMNSLTALEQFLDQMISSVRAQNQAECQHWLAYMNNQLDQVQAAARFAIQSCSLFNSAVQPN